jgi:hypothetical protein
MSYYDYKYSQRSEITNAPFYGLVMALMRQADTENTEKLKLAWPEVYAELESRYNSRDGGLLPEDGANLPTLLENHVVIRDDGLLFKVIEPNTYSLVVSVFGCPEEDRIKWETGNIWRGHYSKRTFRPYSVSENAGERTR